MYASLSASPNNIGTLLPIHAEIKKIVQLISISIQALMNVLNAQKDVTGVNNMASVISANKIISWPMIPSVSLDAQMKLKDGIMSKRHA